MEMTATRPYLLRAFHQWIVDNNLTPFILVDTSIGGVSVPQEHVENGQIVLNLSPSAIVNLNMSNDVVFFQGRFSGVDTEISVPVSAVLGIYAKENGRGMVFEGDGYPEPQPPSGNKKDKAALRVVK